MFDFDLSGIPDVGRLIKTKFLDKTTFRKQGVPPKEVAGYYSKIVPIGCKKAYDVIFTESELRAAEQQGSRYFCPHDKRYFDRGVLVELEIMVDGKSGFKKNKFFKTPPHNVRTIIGRLDDIINIRHFYAFENRVIERALARAESHPEGIVKANIIERIVLKIAKTFWKI